MKKILSVLCFLASSALYGQVNAFSQEKVDQSVEKGAAERALVNVYDESTVLTLPLDGINFLGSSVSCVRTAHGSAFLADCTFTGGGGGGDVATDGIWTASGDLVYGTGTATASRLAAGTSSQVLHSGSTPSWSSIVSGDITDGTIVNADLANSTIDLTAKVTGLLPFANIANGSALSLFGRSANSSGVQASLTCTAAGGGIFREKGSVLVCAVLDATDDGGAIVKQATTPGTVQSTANWNIDGVGTVTKAGILTTDTDAMILNNTTASDAVNTVQKSPAMKWCGHAWNSTGGVDNLDCFRVDLLPVTVAGTTTSTLQFRSSINGGAYSTTSRFSITSGGTLSAAGSATIATNITATAGNITATAGDFILGTNTNRVLWGSGGNVGGIANVGATDGDFRTELNGGTSSTSRFTSGTLGVIGGNSQRTDHKWLAESTGSLNGVTNYTSTIQLPAGAIIEAITYRITTTISGGGVASFTIGDTAGNVGRFCGTQSTLTSTTTGVCMAHRQPTVTDAMGPVQTTADTVKITFNAAPTAGVIRFSIHYTLFTPPTS